MMNTRKQEKEVLGDNMGSFKQENHRGEIN